MSNRPILLVEDTPDDQLLTIRALKKNNLVNEIVLVEDGTEAINYLFGPNGCANGNPDKLPALILLDINLPKMDGLEVLRQIRAGDKTCLIPVVMLTSSKAELDLAASYKLGCNSYIQKPVDYLKFLEAAKQMSLYWLMLNELPPL